MRPARGERPAGSRPTPPRAWVEDLLGALVCALGVLLWWAVFTLVIP